MFKRMKGQAMLTVTNEGQITLPVEVRQALGVVAGSRIEFEIRSNEVVLRRRIPDEAFDVWRGYLVGKTPWNSTDEMMADLRGELMKTAVDSNVLFDLLTNDPRFAGASRDALNQAVSVGALVI